AEWRQKNPGVAFTAFVRLPAFKDMLVSDDPRKGVFGELSNMVSLDPLAGLEPAVRQLEQGRLFAERAMFYMQRLPLVLPIQAELLALKLTQLPAVGSALSDSERISKAAASLAETAAALPAAVSAEREAALKQISAELSAQRQGLIADLDAAQAPT